MPRRGRGRGRLVALALALAVPGWLALRLAAVPTAGIHWDEFALLHLADLTEATGVFEDGGRPGLATAVLRPFVRACEDEIAVIREARVLWTALTLVFLAGLGVAAAQLAPSRRARWRDGMLTVALLAAVPAFVDSSLQVRTDQLALAGGAWGTALLLASRKRPALAFAAGICFGVGFLATQKLVYLAALAGLLAAGQLALKGGLRRRREPLRAILCLLAFGAVLSGFDLWRELSFGGTPPSGQRGLAAGGGPDALAAELAKGFSIFDFYRRTIGYQQYREILPTLLPHALLLWGLVVASVSIPRLRSRDGQRLALAWAVLGLGLVVGLFHAAAFRYFWMTLGVFPAVALGLALGPILRLSYLRERRMRRICAVGFCLVLGFPGALEMVHLLRDTQAVQRESLAFVHRNFESSDAGFHPESGLFCQAGAQPLPTYFSQHIYARFARDPAVGERNQRRLLRAFRETPVAFILQSFRLNQFPLEVRQFWVENYQPYRDSVFVAGRRLAGERGARATFELIVPGRYRWLPATGPQPVAIDGRLLRAGEVVELEPGRYRADFVEDVPAGMLVLALAEPPGQAPRSFYR